MGPNGDNELRAFQLMTSGFDCGNGTYAAADEVTVEELRLLLLSSDFNNVPSTMPKNRIRPTW